MTPCIVLSCNCRLRTHSGFFTLYSKPGDRYGLFVCLFVCPRRGPALSRCRSSLICIRYRDRPVVVVWRSIRWVRLHQWIQIQVERIFKTIFRGSVPQLYTVGKSHVACNTTRTHTSICYLLTYPWFPSQYQSVLLSFTGIKNKHRGMKWILIFPIKHKRQLTTCGK